MDNDDPTGGMACDMSLRDWFASMAMQALIPLWYDENDIFDTPAVADDAYKVADAMLAEKNRKKP